MSIFPLKKAKRDRQSLLAFYVSGSGTLPSGYTRLLDSPEVGAAIDRITSIVASSTIYLMRNTPRGDERVHNALSRFVDIDPWPNMATRQSWISWIVSTMLGEGDGNAFVLPRTAGGRLLALEPMPGATASPSADGSSYTVSWRGGVYTPDMLLHFRLYADPVQPWKGRGYLVQASRIAAAMLQTESLKATLTAPDYKPPLIVSVNSDVPLDDEGKREEIRKSYLEDSDKGKPWIIPGDLMKVEQVRPLSLADLAIRDTVELDKRTVAAIFGVPGFMLGLGSFSQDEFNNFIKTVMLPICQAIEQELTLKLLASDTMYFQFNRRRLYSYDLKALVDIDLAMSDRGFVNGDEVRETAFRDPAGLKEFRVLEKYIPFDMAGMQAKLRPTDKEDNNAE